MKATETVRLNYLESLAGSVSDTVTSQLVFSYRQIYQSFESQGLEARLSLEFSFIADKAGLADLVHHVLKKALHVLPALLCAASNICSCSSAAGRH